MKPGDTSTKREQRRAELLHGIFSRVHGLPFTNEGKFRKARQLGAGRILKSIKTFNRLYPLWKKSQCPATLLRRWSKGQTAHNDSTVWAIVTFAVEKKISTHAACELFELPISYSTVLRRSRTAWIAGKLAKIERERKRLAKARDAALQSIEGIEV